MLEEEFPAFQASLAAPAVSGLRANTLKIAPQALRERLPYPLEPVPWCAEGFYLTGQELQPAPGAHPFHKAGLYYLQEPSAMLPPQVLQPQSDEWVLDLCGAPGGKATHLVSLMKNQGLLVANEVHPRRVWTLAENLERWGARQTVVVNAAPDQLAEKLGAVFDKVLVDAPCSGEGMFRKEPQARQEWSLKAAGSCALRQAAILDSAAALVRPGGKLVYSTCTFNPDENEGRIAAFLQQHPGWELEAIEPPAGFEPARPDWAPTSERLQAIRGAVRLWPHHAAGEGHFVAALRYSGAVAAKARRTVSPSSFPAAPAAVRQAWRAFAGEALTPTAAEALSEGQWLMKGEALYLAPLASPAWEGLKVIHPGLWLGKVAGGEAPRFEPAHALALTLPAQAFQQRLELSLEDPRLADYLRGAPLADSGPAGWLVICVEGFPLGWGKRSQGVIRNRYPHGLRQT